jgi:NADH:ubiquinone oxidoreductase subunit 4 (subunit M)
MFQRVAFGELSDFLKGLGGHLIDVRPVEAMTLVPLAALIVILGLFPGLVLGLINGSVDVTLTHVEAAQHAVQTAVGPWR